MGKNTDWVDAAEPGGVISMGAQPPLLGAWVPAPAPGSGLGPKPWKLKGVEAPSGLSPGTREGVLACKLKGPGAAACGVTFGSRLRPEVACADAGLPCLRGLLAL